MDEVSVHVKLNAKFSTKTQLTRLTLEQFQSLVSEFKLLVLVLLEDQGADWLTDSAVQANFFFEILCDLLRHLPRSP
jgi:hypothetical protein